MSIKIAQTDEGFEIPFPIDGLFNGHIAIFGNTGSGKSNTLATLYGNLVETLQKTDPQLYLENTRFLLFDFNGEYKEAECITTNKRVYNLSTREGTADKLPITDSQLLDIEMLSILSDATNKTQKPFLQRALNYFNEVRHDSKSDNYLQNIVRKLTKSVLSMSDKVRSSQLVDYLRQILPDKNSSANIVDITSDIKWHNTTHQWMMSKTNVYFDDDSNIELTDMYERAGRIVFSSNTLDNLIMFLYIKLIDDVLSNRASNDHISPMLNRLKSRKEGIRNVFDTTSSKDIWKDNNFVVINLDDVNLTMKKTLPLLLCKRIYSDHKNYANKKSLSIIIDEAHNILSRESFRESESWKDYRLETFEEIIKEGRKFGVFITISSQRPNDIS